MNTTHWNSQPLHKAVEHTAQHIDKRVWLVFSGLAGAAYACLSPLPF